MATHIDIKARIENQYTTWTTSLYVTDCASCGVIFAFATELEQRRRADGGTFYCPNGHSMVFGNTDKDRIKKLERQLDDVRTQRDHAREATQREKRQHTATKGQLTKARRRAANGVCPDEECHRSFTDLADHVRTCHPELVKAL